MKAARTDEREAAADEPKRRRLELTVAQVAASALAAVAGAVLASELGVYGTIGGAAVVSVGATVGGAFFQHVFRRTGEQFRERVADPVPVSVRPAEAEFDPFDPGGEHTRMMARIAPPDPAESVTVYQGRRRLRPRSWKLLALSSALVFALAMGAVTVVELAAGKTMADVVQNRSGSGTTVGGSSTPHEKQQVSTSPSVDATTHTTQTSGEKKQTPAPGRSAEPSATPSPTPSGSATPSETPSPSSSEAAQTPTAPSPSSSG